MFWTRMRTLADDSFFKRAAYLKSSRDRPVVPRYGVTVI